MHLGTIARSTCDRRWSLPPAFNVRRGWIVKTAKCAKAAGLDVEAIQVPGEHHTMVGPAGAKAIEFFQQH